MSSIFSALNSFVEAIGFLFSWLPTPIYSLLVSAISVVLIWFVIRLILNVVGTFI